MFLVVLTQIFNCGTSQSKVPSSSHPFAVISLSQNRSAYSLELNDGWWSMFIFLLKVLIMVNFGFNLLNEYVYQEIIFAV